MEYLAHSASFCGQEQTYREHIQGTVQKAENLLETMRPFFSEQQFEKMYAKLQAAAEMHDLGKLSDANQEVLHEQKRTGRLPELHSVMGAHWFYEQGDSLSAALVYGHHYPGLPDIYEELGQEMPFCKNFKAGEFQFDEAKIQKNMNNCCDRHQAVAGGLPQPDTAKVQTALEERLLLSCLVTADWCDTGGKKLPQPLAPRWSERLAALDNYVAGLEEDAQKAENSKERERNRLRHDFYQACRTQTDTNASLQNCEAPVGTGKTTAVLAHLLRCAVQRNLRHLFIVLPYTSILEQMKKVLKDAILLEDEKNESGEIIAVLHHRAEYDKKEWRSLAATWEAPIILTTAVQFFETLASNEPARLYKLHQLPGSGIFLDEFHASAPVQCLPAVWEWLTQLQKNWGCSVVLSSGTMIQFWEERNFRKAYFSGHAEKHPVTVPTPMLPATLQKEMEQQEKIRVHMHLLPQEFAQCRFSTLDELLCFALSQKGPRIIMLDSRRAAAQVAYELYCKGEKVYHLSNAFAPQDSARILDKVKELLDPKNGADGNWTLVSTTYASMGLNLSFRNGFCRAFSCASFLQLAGRISREGEYESPGLWAFTLDDSRFPASSAFSVSAEVWREMITADTLKKPLQGSAPSEMVTHAFSQECKRSHIRKMQDKLLSDERNFEFLTMAKEFKIITEDAEVLAVTNSEVKKMLENGEIPSQAQLQNNSVSIYFNLVKKLHLTEIPDTPKIYWLPPEQYDADLLGCYKALVLK